MSAERRPAGPRGPATKGAPTSPTGRSGGRGGDRSAALRIGAVFVGLLVVGVFAFRTILAELSGASPTPSVPATATVPVATVAPGMQVTFVVEKGDTATTISERLAQMGLVQSARSFRFLVIWRGAEDRLRAGSFVLRQGMTMDQVIEALLAPQVREMSITFIEGRRIEEHAETLGKSGANIDSGQFLALARDGKFAYDFLQGLPKGATAEGYLFPDTYRVIPGETTPDQLVQLMLKRFGQVGTPKFLEDARKATRLPELTMHQLVTIASVVEREAVLSDERAKIAAVYLNRYRDGEGLFADPTVQYAAGKAGAWWPVLRDAPRSVAPDSPYNTYVARGLPPGPICSPGEASLRAVAAPDTTPAKYFVRNDVKNDGSHVFATTLAEHDANRVKYQR